MNGKEYTYTYTFKSQVTPLTFYMMTVCEDADEAMSVRYEVI